VRLGIAGFAARGMVPVSCDIEGRKHDHGCHHGPGLGHRDWPCNGIGFLPNIVSNMTRMKTLRPPSLTSIGAAERLVYRSFPTCYVLLAFGLTSLSFAPQALAFSNRVGMIPNGQVFGCANCHISAGGGGPRNPFGLSVSAITQGNSSVVFWSAALAAQDSDGDGFTNGEELGDPEGDGTPTPGAQVTNPGNPASFPEVPPIQLTGLELLPDGATLSLSWTGGRGPFLVEKKVDSLGEQPWVEVQSTTDRSITVELDEATTFFRVTSQAD
jgi:hypothetical protein